MYRNGFETVVNRSIDDRALNKVQKIFKQNLAKEGPSTPFNL